MLLIFGCNKVESDINTAVCVCCIVFLRQCLTGLIFPGKTPLQNYHSKEAKEMILHLDQTPLKNRGSTRIYVEIPGEGRGPTIFTGLLCVAVIKQRSFFFFFFLKPKHTNIKEPIQKFLSHLWCPSLKIAVEEMSSLLSPQF